LVEITQTPILPKVAINKVRKDAYGCVVTFVGMVRDLSHINCNPDNPSYRYLIGFTYSIQSQWDKAIGEFEVALDKEPNNSEYLRGLGWALHCAGDKAKGLAYLHRAVDLAPTNVNILTDLAAAYLSDLQFHKAREYAEMTVRIDPNSNIATEVLANIGRFQRKLGRFAEPQ